MEPLRISPNGRYFVEQDGTPFFWLGDTQWELIRLFSADDARAVVEGRKRQGFSVLQVMLTGVGDGSGADLSGQTPWLNDDPATPNEAYLRNADAVLRMAAEAGMVICLGVYHQLQVDRITTAKARAYAHSLAERWRDLPNLVWSMYPQARAEYVPVCRELAAGLRQCDGGAHLLTVHPDPAPTSSSFLHDEPWLDFNTQQPCIEYERIYEMVTADYHRTPVKPVVMGEGGYEGNDLGRVSTPLDIRRQAYWSHLAGGHHTYGINDAWKRPDRWREWLDTEGAANMTVYREVLTSLPRWWEWVPDQSLIAEAQPQKMPLKLAARAASGDWAIVYLSDGGSVTLKMPSGMSATWIDPRSGGRREIGPLPADSMLSFEAPENWPDALLLLTAR